MKDGINEIIGKKIRGVVVSRNERREPENQVFIVFDDGTYFEFYGSRFTCNGGVDRGDAEVAINYARHFGAEITQIYP
jgi:hypothetical protein